MVTMVKRKREDVQKRKRGDSQNGIQSGSLTSQESLGGKRHLTQSKRKECLPSKKNTQPLAIRPHGKDAKLVLQVAETSTEPRPSREMAFDAKSIGKKAVFRPILTTPFKADWPEIPGAVGQTIFHSLCDLLGQPIVQRQVANRSEATTRRQPARKTKEKNKRRRARLLLGILHEHGILHEQELGPLYNTPHVASSAQTSKPILCGLNSLTRQLQDSIHDATRQNHREDAPKKHSPSYIFCCIDDIDPPSLVAHLPLLVAAYNAVHDTSTCLVRLPVGAEGTIANKVGLRRCAILSVDADELSHSCSSSTQAVDALRILMENIAKGGIEPMRLGWIKEALHGKAPYLEPRIKHLRSSAPVDVNAIKAAKREARKQRKGQGR